MDQLKWQKQPFAERLTRNFFETVLEKTNAPAGAIVNDVNTLTRNISEVLWRGDTMYVTQDMQHLMIQAAHDLPEDYRWDMHTLLCPFGFCMLEETIYGEDVHGETLGMSAMSWSLLRHSDDQQVLAIYFWTSTSDVVDAVNTKLIPKMRADGLAIGPLMLSHYYLLGDGESVTPGKDDNNPQGSDLVDATLGLFAAMNILAHQTIGEPIKLPPNRASRKRYARDFTNAPERMITLITLRRKTAQKQDPDAPPVPWSRRWVVRGHWRKQPDKAGWHWTYIYEYIKGPEDKPLIVTERRVFNFRR
jgi:hypothetical protein